MSSVSFHTPKLPSRALHFDDVADRPIDRFGRRETGIGAPQAGDRIDIEQRQRSARRLFEAAIGIAVERPQQPGDVPIGTRADGQKRLGGARQELVGGVVVEA